MGYSARYHAVSLVAVFLALAIGILIGAEFGDDVISGTSERLEESLQGDVEEARIEVEELEAELARLDEFASRVYPALVGGRLEGRRIGLISLGDLSDDLQSDVESALEPTGGEIAAVGVVREPPDLGALADTVEDRRLSGIRKGGDALGRYARAVGSELAGGGPLLRSTDDILFVRSAGSQRRLDGLVVARQVPGELSPAEEERTARLENGLLNGIAAAGVPAVGVERTPDEESSIELYAEDGLATVDDVDLVAGRVALVYALLGAEGNFGVKETADRLLPDVLFRSRPSRR